MRRSIVSCTRVTGGGGRARRTSSTSSSGSFRQGATTNILDIGCGDGLMFEALSRFGDVEGVEIDASIVSEGGRWADRIFVGPFDTFEVDRRYGLILMLDALEHMQNPARSLRRAVDLLMADGIVVLTVPAFNSLWTSHDVVNEHVERFTRRTLGALAAQSGAQMISSSYFFHWLAPVKLAVRAKEMVFAPRSVNPRIPPGWLNTTLIGLSRIEQRAVSRLPMPFGGSLFAVIAPR